MVTNILCYLEPETYCKQVQKWQSLAKALQEHGIVVCHIVVVANLHTQGGDRVSFKCLCR